MSSPGHEWTPHEREGWSVCSRCGMVRNYDREMTTCSGASAETPGGSSENPPRRHRSPPHGAQVTITDDELARLEALAQAATQGPYTITGRMNDDDTIVCVDNAQDEEHLEVCDTGESRQGIVNAQYIHALLTLAPALVAEVRQVRVAHEAAERHVLSLRKEYDRMYAEREEFRLKAKGFKEERDALRAENERLRAAVEAAPLVELYLKAGKERDGLLIEATELRASLADAVAKIALLEPVCTEALARRRAFHARHQDKEGAWEEYDRAREAFGTALDRYEASLPSIAKETR